MKEGKSMEPRPQIGALRLQLIERSPKTVKEPSFKPRCFFCHEEVDPELVLMVNNTLEEMVCICGKHFHELP
jgi:hypothetical protein